MRLLGLLVTLFAYTAFAARIPLVQNNVLAFPTGPGEYQGFALILISPTETLPGDDQGLLVLPENPPRVLLEEQRLLAGARDRAEYMQIIERFHALLPTFTEPQAYGQWPWAFREAALRRAERDSRRLLRLAYDFACDVDLKSGNFGETLPDGIQRDVARILTGENPVILVVDLKDPSKIFQVVSIAYQDADGLVPLEHRLNVRLPKTGDPVESDEEHPFVYWRDPARPFPAADKIYKKAKIWTAGRAEIKLYVRNPDIPIDWGRLFRRLMIANRFSQLNASMPKPFPKKPEGFLLDFLGLYADAKDDALRRRDYMEVMALRQAFWDMTVSQWAVRNVWLDQIVVQAVGAGIGRVYETHFDMNEELIPAMDDPDVKVRDKGTGLLKPARVRVLGAKRAHWERTAMLDKRWYEEGHMLARPRIQRARQSSPFPDEDHCATLLTWERYMAEFMDGNHLRLLYPSSF